MVDEDKIKRYLEPTEYLKEHLKDIIEAFVEYYGEEHREYIVEKLSKILLIAHQSDEDLGRKLFELEEEYGEEYVKSRLKKYNDYLDENKEIERALFKKYNREYILKMLELLPKEYVEYAKKYLDSNEGLFAFCMHNNCVGLNHLLGNFNKPTSYDYFTPEIEANLNNPETIKREKVAILRERQSYFWAIGIDKGEDIFNYIGLEDYYPSQEFCLWRKHYKNSALHVHKCFS